MDETPGRDLNYIGEDENANGDVNPVDDADARLMSKINAADQVHHLNDANGGEEEQPDDQGVINKVNIIDAVGMADGSYHSEDRRVHDELAGGHD